MPPETAPHERTLISWPCRRELWGSALNDAKHDMPASPKQSLPLNR